MNVQRHFKQDPFEVEAADEYVIALEPGFCSLSLISALETLQKLNDVAGREIARWMLCSAGGEDARSSVGLRFPVEGGLPDVPRRATVVLVGGDAAAGRPDPALIRWLHQCARKSVRFAALHSASLTLARAGILTWQRATIHWLYHDCLAEHFPDIDLKKSTYTIHDNICTTAGGTSAIDLLLALAERDHGRLLTERVAEQINYSAIRVLQEDTRIDVASRRHIRHPKLHAVIRMMEENLEDPVSPSIFARQVNVSTRQLERLFQKYLGKSPKRFYTDLRLARAHRLLVHAEMSVTEVAVACGFTSLSHFSKTFRSKYQVSPYHLRWGGRAGAA